MSEQPVDPWYAQVLKSIGNSATSTSSEDPIKQFQTESSSDVRQQTLADLYEEWADSIPPENQVEFLKLCNRLRLLTHDTNDPLALILYTIGTSTKIHLLLPHKIQQECQTILHDLDGKMDQIRGLHNQAVDRLSQAQIKLVTEYGALCDLTILRCKDALHNHLQSIDERGRKLYTILDQQTVDLKKLQSVLVETISKLLAKPVEQAKTNEALLKHIQEVVARVDVLFLKTYRTILFTFCALVVGAFIAGLLLRPYL